MDNSIKFNYEDCLKKTDEIFNSFNKNGIVQINNVFSEKLCLETIQVLKGIESNFLENLNDIGLVTEEINKEILIKYYQGLFSKNPIFRKFFSSRLIRIAQILLKDEDLYFSDIETHIRNPGGSSIPKHQDNFYFNLANAKGVTCYVALNSHDISLGGLNYILGSHIKRVIPHSLSKEAGFSSGIENSTIKKIGLKGKKVYHPIYLPGSITIHHPENIHFADSVAINSQRSFALSVRIFSNSETIDEEGVKRYKKLLSQNRT